MVIQCHTYIEVYIPFKEKKTFHHGVVAAVGCEPLTSGADNENIRCWSLPGWHPRLSFSFMAIFHGETDEKRGPPIFSDHSWWNSTSTNSNCQITRCGLDSSNKDVPSCGEDPPFMFFNAGDPESNLLIYRHTYVVSQTVAPECRCKHIITSMICI